MKTNSISSWDKSNISYNVKIEDLTFNFAKKIVLLRKKLVSSDNKEFIISKQILRSGTSIGANIAEAEHPQSNADYLNKVSIALKEANETKFWIRLLKECGYITSEEESVLLNDCYTIIKILVSIVNKVRKRLNK
jgi:four helix bundle protein